MRYVDRMGLYDERPPRPLLDFPQESYEWTDDDAESIERLLNPPQPVRLEGTTLYRYFDADGKLLYIGITNHAVLRALQHSRFSRWWPSVRSATFEHYATRDEALAAEAAAITRERPPHNVAGHPDHAPFRGSRRRASFEVRRLDRTYESPADFDAQRAMYVLLMELAKHGWPEL